VKAIRLTTKDISKITGTSMGRLGAWLDRGYIWASIKKATGYGTRNYFSVFDVYRAVLFTRLMDLGFTREGASKIANKGLNKKSILEFRYGLEDQSQPGLMAWLIVGRKVIEGKEETVSQLHFPRSQGTIGHVSDPNDLEWDGFGLLSSAILLEEQVLKSFNEDTDNVFIVNLAKIMASVQKYIEKKSKKKKA